jgi:NAD(P)-dependent dehydrogenase (short-subunit alcohol dehydrogenase family)
MNSKVAIVTGANGGMGRVITETLAQSGFEVVMACRDLDKSIPVWQKISEKTQANIHLIRLDLSSLESVLQFIHEIRTRFTHIDLLINNAGVMPSKALESDYGMEYTIGVNYFSPYLITTALTKMMPIGARVVNVSSLMYRYGKITPSVFDSLKGKHYSRFNAYANSKLALLFMGIDLSDTLQKQGITINVCEPGIVNTPILKMGNRLVDFLANLLFRPFIRSPKKGAETILYLALDESVAEKSGSFYSNKKVVKLPQKYFEGEERYLLRKLTQQYIETNQITQ